MNDSDSHDQPVAPGPPLPAVDPAAAQDEATQREVREQAIAAAATPALEPPAASAHADSGEIVTSEPSHPHAPEPAHAESPPAEAPHAEATRAEPGHTEPAHAEAARTEPAPTEPARAEAPSASAQADAPQTEHAAFAPRAEAPPEPARPEAAQPAVAPTGSAQSESAQPESAQIDAPPAEPAPAEAAAPAPAPPPDPRVEERKRRAQQAWERVVAAREGGEVLTGTVTAAVKGGLLVDVGSIRGFLPASQVRVPQGTAIDTLVKTKLPLKVIDIDQSRRRIVVSHRRAAEEERRSKRTEVLKSLAVGQVREGTVVRLTDFGAFVDLGGIDGLIPMRELAFERVEKTADVVSVGEKLPVEVLRIDEGGKKISLSRKNALPDPWRDHADVLRPGKTVEGKVVAKEPRLQVEIAPGIVGAVREGDANPADYELGEPIEVIVRRADRATRRITLGTAHGESVMPPPQQNTSSGFAPLGVELGRRPGT